MAATLTATKNPVGIWGDTSTVTGTTTIAWDTGSAQRGRVYILVATPPNIPLNETLFAGNPTTGDRTGSKALTVKFGSTYTLVLRQVSNNAVLATLVVTVTDLLQEAAEQAAAAAAMLERENPSQAIHGLRIHAGTDTVRVTFKTVQPTIPVIQVLRLDGTEVDSSFALGAGMQTSHQATLGLASPLDQATEFEVKILASGHTRLGKPHDVRASNRFTTGSRPTTVFFTEIDVWRDGDPGLKGDGEFTFSFGAGDADGRTNLGEPWPGEYKGDINDDDPPKFINEKIDIPLGPRNLWIQVIGTENDADVFSGAGYNLGRKPHFFGAGSDWADTGDEYQTSVTGVFDISEAVYGTTLPLELVTGNFGVAFTIRGTIFIQTQPGISPVIFDFKKTTTANTGMGKLIAAGDTGSLPDAKPGTGGKRGTLVARGADGATYWKIPDAIGKERRDAGWALAAPAVAGPVTALAVGPDRMALFALDAEGAALYTEIVGDRSPRQSGEARPAKWRRLTSGSYAGRFTGAVIAVVLAASVELLACDAAGAVFHLTLPAQGGKPDSDWRRIGESLGGEVKAVRLGKDAMAVFALGRRGEVRHMIYRDGRWRKEGWQVIAGATGVQLGVASAGADSPDAEQAGVVVAVIGEDMQLHTLAWRDYPAKKPAPWLSHGDFQAWLVRPVKPKSGKSGKTKLKPAAARRARARTRSAA